MKTTTVTITALRYDKGKDDEALALIAFYRSKEIQRGKTLTHWGLITPQKQRRERLKQIQVGLQKIKSPHQRERY